MQKQLSNKAMQVVNRYNAAKRTAEQFRELAANEEIQAAGFDGLMEQLGNVAQTIATQATGGDFDTKEADFTKRPLTPEQVAGIRVVITEMSKALGLNDVNQEVEACSKPQRMN